MRKLSLPQKPENYDASVSSFTLQHPPKSTSGAEKKRWDAFKKEEQKLLKEVKKALFENQQGLCAYCECSLTSNNQEIEHFKPKSHSTHVEDNTTNFHNFTMSCRGNIVIKGDDHCGHLKGDKNPHGIIICPYDLPDGSLFSFKSVDKFLRIFPNKTMCKKYRISELLVQSTIDNLGLDTDTVAQIRWEIWNGIQDQIDDVEELPEDEQNAEYLSIIEDNSKAQNGILPSYITMRTWALQKEFPNII